jgi:hypothetical protein
VYLEQHGIHSHNFVAYLGAYTDPVDNHFNAEFRARVNRALANVNQLRPLSGREKLDLLCSCYYDFKQTSIKHYCERTGLIGNSAPREVVQSLISEATSKHKDKFDRLYKHQLLAYVRAAHESNIRPQQCPDLVGPWWDVIRENK